MKKPFPYTFLEEDNGEKKYLTKPEQPAQPPKPVQPPKVQQTTPTWTPSAQTQSTPTQSAPAPSASTEAPASVGKFGMDAYDPASDTAYQQALQALEQARKGMPEYQASYDQQLLDLYNQIVGRDKFSYDLNADALYQQYRDQYTRLGQMAMMDTMGQASALTGGYGSSYAQGVGQQAYQGYLQQLNNVVPELYGMALDQYNREGQDLMNQYAMLGDLADDEYGKYMDALNQYWQGLSFAKGEADDAYNRGLAEWQTDYNLQQDAYSRLTAMMANYGYRPTAEELAAAGIPQAQADAILNAYAAKNAPRSGGSGRSKSEEEAYQFVKNMLDNATSSNFDPKRVIKGATNEQLTNKQKKYALEILDKFLSAGYMKQH